MKQKLELVKRAAKGEKVAALCREYGVSRQTGHKWITRFKKRGYEGLEEERKRHAIRVGAVARGLEQSVGVVGLPRHPSGLLAARLPAGRP
jgi:transposase-like protein